MPAVDIIVIGTSAGGLQPLLRIVKKRPRDWPRAVSVVVHTPAQFHRDHSTLLSLCAIGELKRSARIESPAVTSAP